MDNRLKEYIQTAQGHGLTKEQIYSNLHAVGWALHEIEEALMPQRKKPWYRWDGYHWRHYFRQKEVRQSFQIFVISFSLLCLTVGFIMGYEYYRDFTSSPSPIAAAPVATVTLAPTPSPLALVPTAWQLFHQEELKFSLEVPAGWFVREIKSPNAEPVSSQIFAINNQPLSSQLLKEPPYAYIIVSPQTSPRLSWYQEKKALTVKKQAEMFTLANVKGVKIADAVAIVSKNHLYEIHFNHAITSEENSIDQHLLHSFQLL